MSDSSRDLQRRTAAPAGKELAGKSEVANFLQKVASLPPAGVRAGGGRLLFALDATGSRERTWDQASQLQAEMFLGAQAQGGLQVQLTYFRGLGEFYKTPWCRDSSALLGLMTGIQCRAGITQIERVLRHALTENKSQRIHCVVYVGDAMEENPDVLVQLAGQLGILNVPLFLFQEGADPLTLSTFQTMAKASRGAWCQFDGASANQLRELLRAVAVYASGGLQALQKLSHSSGDVVKRLTRQMGA